jgi:hypothetical protein
MKRSWKLWKPGRRRKAAVALDFHARELLLLPLRARPDWPRRRMAPLEGAAPAAGARLIAFAGCDPSYFEELGVDLLRSIARHSPDTAVHLHLYHPEARHHALVASLQRELRLPFSFSWEDCRLDGLTRRQRVNYYEAARFVRLAALLERCSVPILSLDTDCIVRGPLTRMLDATGDADVGLVLRPERGDSGLNVLAALMLARATDGARLYFRDVARRIARHLMAKPSKGFVDQRCMWLAYRKLCKRVRFAAIPPSTSDDAMRDDSEVWHAKGERARDERFQLARAELRVGDPA